MHDFAPAFGTVLPKASLAPFNLMTPIYSQKVIFKFLMHYFFIHTLNELEFNECILYELCMVLINT